ncbi:hypothetical protein [uncultured Dysgonomonas sp.]|nr:hypothetical protein [uncultured Dysgonomonas sp.]
MYHTTNNKEYRNMDATNQPAQFFHCWKELYAVAQTISNIAKPFT